MQMKSAELVEMISVKNLFCVNQAVKNAHNSLRKKIFGWTDVPGKMNCFYLVILEN